MLLPVLAERILKPVQQAVVCHAFDESIIRTLLDLFNRESNGPITFVRHFYAKSAKKFALPTVCGPLQPLSN